MTDDDTALGQWLKGTHLSAERAPRARGIGFARREAVGPGVLARIRGWTRERFSLDEEIAVMVAELACTLPGCPPRETVIAFWTAPDRRHHFKIFKPAADIVSDDLPPAWLKDALVVAEGDCDCC